MFLSITQNHSSSVIYTKMQFTLALNRLHGVKKRRVYNPANIDLFKVNNRSTRKMCETCSKLTIKTPEQRHLRCLERFYEGL